MFNVSEHLKNKNLKIFFSGIGGISMSSIAAALNQKGYKVSGSDINENSTVKLKDMGIEIFNSHKSENLEGCGMLVYNARIKNDNPEIIMAKELNIPIIKRSEMLGALISGYKTSVGVAGTHGKSTVTAMVSEIFIQANTNPSFFIGAEYPPVNSAYKLGSDDFCIVECDEFSDSFLNIYPDITAILNIEMDHPDFFKDLNAVIDSFEKFTENTSNILVINIDDENVIKASQHYKGNIITYSLKDPSADIFINNINYPDGFPEFDIVTNNFIYTKLKLSVPGEYNIYNAAAAAGIGHSCKLDSQFIGKGLELFKGVSRRFECKGVYNGATVYDDYAHHPTAIKKSLLESNKIAKAINGNLWYIFQPHTYSRTNELFEEFCEALSHSENLILTEIYSAAEENIYGISSENIAAKLNNCVFIKDFGEIEKYLRKRVQKNDLIIIAGAGDINNLTKLLV